MTEPEYSLKLERIKSLVVRWKQSTSSTRNLYGNELPARSIRQSPKGLPRPSATLGIGILVVVWLRLGWFLFDGTIPLRRYQLHGTA